MLRLQTPRAVRAALVLTGLSAAACAPLAPPMNVEGVASGASYQAQYREEASARATLARESSAKLNAGKCAADGSIDAAGPATAPAVFSNEGLSPGDLLRVNVGEDQIFTGDYVVSRDGKLTPPYLKALDAAGRSAVELGEELRNRLVAEGYYNAPGPRVSVRVAEFAPVRISVSGAVFEPREVIIGDGSENRDLVRQNAIGGSTEARNLSFALRAAGGVRPDADLARVRVVRAGQEYVLDLRRAVVGRAFPDVMLMSGDEVIVPSRGCFQEALMAPTSVTPPGVKAFMSNLTKSTNTEAAYAKDTRELRYGTRMMQAVIGMNCLGGSKLTDADRSAALFSRNPITGNSVVIERRLEDMLRSADRDELDPFILPGDSLVCYDSAITSITELAKSFGIVIGTSLLLSL